MILLGQGMSPLGYAVSKNKLKCVNAISSNPGVDFSRGRQASALGIALMHGHEEAAKILAGKGALCTEAEKMSLADKYTNLQREIENQRRSVKYPVRKQRVVKTYSSEEEDEYDVKPKEEDEHYELKPKVVRKQKEGVRIAIKEWMDNEEFVNLGQWLKQSRNQLKALCATGDVPVAGWLRLADIIKNKESAKKKLEAEVDENAREREQLAQQISSLLKRQQELEDTNIQLQAQMRRMQEIGTLEAENQSISFLCQKEAASIAKVGGVMKNQYFLDAFDSEDISTVFSMFDMDALFLRFKNNDTDSNLEVTRTTPVEHLKMRFGLTFAEAVELQWKLKLLKKGEKGVQPHLEKCRICSSNKIGVLLREYGMAEAESKEMEGKMQDWKGYFLATVNATSAAIELGIARQKSKLPSCLVAIQRAHQWEHK